MPKKEKVTPPVKPLKGQEAAYRRQLFMLGKQLTKAISTQVLIYLKANQNLYVADGIGTDLTSIFERLNAQFTGAVTASFANTVATNMVNGIEQKSLERYNKSVKYATGVDLGGVVASEGLVDFVALSIGNNASLIKTLPEDYLKDVQTIVTKGVLSGAKYSNIAKEITGLKGLNSKLKNRINTIARDQTQTINSQITLRRAESIGVTEGIWRTSDDASVRSSHKKLNGVKFKLSKGAPDPENPGRYIWPGISDINCRCTFSSVIEVQ